MVAPGTQSSGKHVDVLFLLHRNKLSTERESSFLPVPASAEVLLGLFTFLSAVCTRILKELGCRL